MRSQLLWLNNSVDLDLALVGGKAAGLARLCKLGVRVPEGVIVPSNVMMSGDLDREIKLAVATIVSNAKGATTFAVRSSATVEDGSRASYAGMYKTLLEVAPDEVVPAVKECRCSVNSARIHAYRNAMNRIQDESAAVAVVIQRMLNPDVSGVAFTVNPITGDTHEMIIEAAAGLGDRLVGGEVTPDYYCLRLSDGALLTFEPGDDNIGGTPLLSLAQQLFLCAEAKRISDFFGLPVDLEFAIMNAELYLLQARPVTEIISQVKIA